MSDSWSVSIPLADLQKLLATVGQLEDTQRRIERLEKEILGLRQIQSDILQYFADQKRGNK